MDSNLIGGIVGSILGVMGGIVGTYFSIKNTNGPKERAFMVRCAVLTWIGVSVFLLGLGLVTFSQSPNRFVVVPMLWLVYMPLLFWLIRWGNQRQARYRAEDAADAGHPSGGSIGL